MNCREFEEHLEDFLEMKSQDSVSGAASEHLRFCAACAALVDALRGASGVLGTDTSSMSLPGGVPDLAGAILWRTTGSNCGRAQDQLGALVYEELASQDAFLVRGHLEHCGRCHALCEALVALRQTLPEMAELAPDARLAGDVLRATAVVPVHRSPWRAQLRQAWVRLVSRPRFALEMAYVGTLVLVLLFGTSMSPLKQVPSRALAVVQIDPRGVWQTSTHHFFAVRDGIGRAAGSAWGATGDRVVDRMQASASDYAERHPGMPEATANLSRNASELRQALASLNFAHASLAADALAGDLKALWRSFKQPASPSSR